MQGKALKGPRRIVVGFASRSRFGSEITPCHLADTRGGLLTGGGNLIPVRCRTRSFRYRLYETFIQRSLPSEQISRVIFEIPYRD